MTRRCPHCELPIEAPLSGWGAGRVRPPMRVDDLVKAAKTKTTARDGGTVGRYIWHPQWGGYVAPCLVTTDADASNQVPPGCFDVLVWHDGEHSRLDEDPRELHYCDPMQVIRFGLEVLELQAEHSRPREYGDFARKLRGLLEEMGHR